MINWIALADGDPSSVLFEEKGDHVVTEMLKTRSLAVILTRTVLKTGSAVGNCRTIYFFNVIKNNGSLAVKMNRAVTDTQ